MRVYWLILFNSVINYLFLLGCNDNDMLRIVIFNILLDKCLNVLFLNIWKLIILLFAVLWIRWCILYVTRRSILVLFNKTYDVMNINGIEF